jgi:hypothetical protein
MRWRLRVVGVAWMWVDAGNTARGFFFLGTTGDEWTSEWTRCNLLARCHDLATQARRATTSLA